MFVRQGVLGGMKVPNTCSSSSLSLSLECHFIKDFDELSWVGNQQSTPKHLYYVYCLELLMIKQLKLLEILGRYPHKRICTDLGYLGIDSCSQLLYAQQSTLLPSQPKLLWVNDPVPWLSVVTISCEQTICITSKLTSQKHSLFCTAGDQ